MKVIVSTTYDNVYQQFEVVKSMTELEKLNDVDTVVIHKYPETDFDAGVIISGLVNKGVKKFLYINTKPSSTIRMVLNGVDGHYFEDTFYLDDEEELIELVNSLDEDVVESPVTDLATSSLDIVSNFIKSFARGDERIKAPLYLEQVTQALNELSVITHQQELQISSMGATAIEVFEKASSLVQNMEKQRQLLESQLDELESNANSANNRSQVGGIYMYPPYKYLEASSKILLFREYSPCRFLTTMCIAYARYLKIKKNKRVKLIFVHQKGAGVSAKYSSFASENANVESLFDADIVSTNDPKKDIMKRLTSKGDDIIIVVDRLYSNTDIITGRVAVKINAVTSESDIARYGLVRSETINSVSAIKDNLFTIPSFKGFNSANAVSVYLGQSIFQEFFKKLDDKLKI